MPRPGPAAGFPAVTHPQKRAFLLAYTESMRVDLSSRAAGVSRHIHKWWMKHDEDYAAAFTEAKEMAAEMLEAEAIRRAREGVTRTVYHQGEPVGTELVYSDTLLIFLLKGAKPDVYKERYEHTGKDGGPIQVAHMAPDVRQARLAALLAKRNGQPQPQEV
jgi:hypothetical protein